MTGIIDVGGGMRDIYGAGVLDYCLDSGISFDLCIGVSAGSANLASFLARQRGRTYKFYAEYPKRWQYMSFKNMALTGEFFNLEYIYSFLSNEGGEYPIDFDAFASSKSDCKTVVTNAKTGKAEFLPKEEITRNDLWAIKASCAMPVACKPFLHGESVYFDGGVSDPIPVKAALEMGCDRVYVVIPRPLIKKRNEFSFLMKPFLRDYPEVLKLMKNRPKIYNAKIDELLEYEKQGKAVIIAPESDRGINMITRNSKKLNLHYRRGYSDAAKLIKP